MDSVYTYLKKKIEKETLHVVLIDPDSSKKNNDFLEETAKRCNELRIDALMIGGSTGYQESDVTHAVKTLKKCYHNPIILFPGNTTGVSSAADAIFFMSLLNSRNPYWITGAQYLSSGIIKRLKMETLSMGYLVVEPGCTAGLVGDAQLIPRNKPDIAVAYALAASYLGMKFVYLEAGSGATETVPNQMIKKVREQLSDSVLVVGGGINTVDKAYAAKSSGAQIIVTGNIIEEKSYTLLEKINYTIKSR